MARGYGDDAIPYFSFDVTQNDAVSLIEAECGLKGFAVYVHLLQHIYGGKGYYVYWDKDVALMFARKYGVGINAVSEIVAACIRRGIFDNDKYTDYSVLTSKEIQDGYFFAVKRRKQVKIIEEILLIDPCEHLNSACIIKQNVDILTHNVNKQKQRIVKNSIGYINSCGSKSEAANFSLFTFGENNRDDEEMINNLDPGEVAKLTAKCDTLIYEYWGRTARAYDYSQAVNVLNMYSVKILKLPVQHITENMYALLEEAFLISADNSATKWSYIFGIFRKWTAAGIKSCNDLIDFQIKHSKHKK